MDIDKQMLRQLALTIEKKVMTDEVKAFEKSLKSLGKKLNGLNENIEIAGDVHSIHASLRNNLTELQKVLKANGLL